MVEMLLLTPKGLKVRRSISSRSVDLHAPYLIDVEVAHVLRRMVRMEEISLLRGGEALQDFRDMEITRYPHEGLLRRIWALRENLSAYDAAYVALAEALGVALVTCDRRLGAAPGHNASVELI
jgi:predicted nucleic acid-binding protein